MLWSPGFLPTWCLPTSKSRFQAAIFLGRFQKNRMTDRLFFARNFGNSRVGGYWPKKHPCGRKSCSTSGFPAPPAHRKGSGAFGLGKFALLDDFIGAFNLPLYDSPLQAFSPPFTWKNCPFLSLKRYQPPI